MADPPDSTPRPADETSVPPATPPEPGSPRAPETVSEPASERVPDPTSVLDGGMPPATPPAIPPAPPIATPISPPGGPVPAATPTGHGRGDGRDRAWVGGVVLIAIGVAFLLGQLLPNAGRFVPLLIGLIFLAVFLVMRNYGYLVPGGIVTGVGVGVVLAMEDQGRVGGGLFLVSLGLGFVGIFILAALFRLRENHPWPLIPGGILCTIGLITLGGTRYDEVARVAWPAVLIALGLLFVLRGLLRRPPA